MVPVPVLIRIRIELTSWIWIRLEVNPDSGYRTLQNILISLTFPYKKTKI
jgi:hypothetical protein